MAKPKRRNPHSVVFHSVKARRPFLKKKATNATATCTPLAEENAETIESVTQALPTLTALEARLDSRQIWNFYQWECIRLVESTYWTFGGNHG